MRVVEVEEEGARDEESEGNTRGEGRGHGMTERGSDEVCWITG